MDVELGSGRGEYLESFLHDWRFIALSFYLEPASHLRAFWVIFPLSILGLLVYDNYDNDSIDKIFQHISVSGPLELGRKHY